MVQEELLKLCWAQSRTTVIIKAIKFVELVTSNMVAVTNLAICVNLALIIYSHRNLSRVRSLSSPKLMISFLALSMLATVTAVPFWDKIVATGGHVLVVGSSSSEIRWVIFSQFILELFSGVVMVVVVIFIVVFRWPELVQVWKLHRRIQYYFGLTLIAILSDLGVAIGGTLVVFYKYNAILMAFAFSCRNVHIALDTIVLYYGLGKTRFDIDYSSTVTSEERELRTAGIPPKAYMTHSPSGHKSSTDGSPPLERTAPSEQKSSINISPSLEHTVPPFVC